MLAQHTGDVCLDEDSKRSSNDWCDGCCYAQTHSHTCGAESLEGDEVSRRSAQMYLPQVGEICTPVG